MTENTVAISESELDELRERAREAERSTRERSIAKPQDHKPAIKEPITVEFAGNSYTFDLRAAKDTRTMFALRNDDMQTVLVRVLGEKGLEDAIKSIEDEDGYSDFEELAKFVAAIYEKAGAKNS